jgi:hypothetical protein
MTKEEREELPGRLRRIAGHLFKQDDCNCDRDVGYQCEACEAMFWVQRAAEEIERLSRSGSG